MGQWSQLAWNPNALPVWPSQHEVAACEGECSPVIRATCAGCSRVYLWCTASAFTVRAIVDRTWTCAACRSGS